MNPRDIKNYPIVWTVGNQSQEIFVGDFRDVVLTIVGTGVATVLCSCDEDVPDFTSPSTISNSYKALVIADLAVPNSYSVSLAAVADTQMGEINTNLIRWICVTRSVNTLDGFITACDNA